MTNRAREGQSAAEIGGRYRTRFAEAGALAPSGTPEALDPKHVHDLVLELQCRVAPVSP